MTQVGNEESATNKSPQRFYRYRSLSESSMALVERTVCHNELYFSAPTKFNDPFDCRPCFSFDASGPELKSYMDRILIKFMPQLNAAENKNERAQRLLEMEGNMRRPKARAEMQARHTETVTEKVGVLCLSEICDDILMWSHYGDSHKGICLEFDASCRFFAQAQPVKYKSLRPALNPIRHSPDEMMEAALLTKARHWSYELEWRIIHYRRGPGVYHFPPDALTGIVFGAQADNRAIDAISEWIKRSSSKPRLLFTSVNDTEYRLNIHEHRRV